MEENKEQQERKCNGHCETCNINQRTYCAAQISLYNQQEISRIVGLLGAIIPTGDSKVILREKAPQNEEKQYVSEPITAGVDE